MMHFSHPVLLASLLHVLSFAVAAETIEPARSVDSNINLKRKAEEDGSAFLLRGQRSLAKAVCGDGVKEGPEKCDLAEQGNCQYGCTNVCTCAASGSVAPTTTPPTGDEYDLWFTDLRRSNCQNTCARAGKDDIVYLTGSIRSLTQTISASYTIKFYLMQEDASSCDPTTTAVALLNYAGTADGSLSGQTSFNQNSSGEWYFGLGAGPQLRVPTDIASGFYKWCAVVDTGKDLDETNEDNNIAISADRVRIS